MRCILPISILLSLIAIGVHYEALAVGCPAPTDVARRAPHPLRPLRRGRLFAVGWSHLLAIDMATLSGVVSGPTNILYFSLVTYTSLGYGDIAPLGPARLLAGIESLIGLGLIARSASFTYLKMQRYWYERDGT